MSKKEINGRLEKLRQDVDKLLAEKRLEWLHRIQKEAKAPPYSFKTLGELVAFIVDHASEMQEDP